jgi:hypothetical protein
MIVPCGFCLAVVDATSRTVSCSGICNRKFHINCVNISKELHSYICSTAGLSWKCAECETKCFTVDQSGLTDFLDRKHSEMFAHLNHVFDDVKKDFTRIVNENLKIPTSTSSTPTYAQIIKNKTQPAIIIKPKNIEQTPANTKSDVKQKINPVESQLSLRKVKNTKDGGLLIGFSSKEDNIRFKKLALEKLSDDYSVHEIKGVQPRLKVVGMSELYDEADFIEHLEYALRNSAMSLNLNNHCKLVKYWPTKKTTKFFRQLYKWID